MVDYEKEMNDENTRWILLFVGGLLTFFIINELREREIHITYSGDNFLKVEENWRGEIAKVERCTFDRARVIQGLRPYYTCDEIGTYEEVVNNQFSNQE